MTVTEIRQILTTSRRQAFCLRNSQTIATRLSSRILEVCISSLRQLRPLVSLCMHRATMHMEQRSHHFNKHLTLHTTHRPITPPTTPSLVLLHPTLPTMLRAVPMAKAMPLSARRTVVERRTPVTRVTRRQPTRHETSVEGEAEQTPRM